MGLGPATWSKPRPCGGAIGQLSAVAWEEAVAGVILDDLEAKAVPLRLMQPIVAMGVRTVAEEDRGGRMKDARETLGAGLIRDHRITQIEASRSMWSSRLVT